MSGNKRSLQRRRKTRTRSKPRGSAKPDPKLVQLQNDQLIIRTRKITELTSRHMLRALNLAKNRGVGGLTLDTQEVEWAEPGAMLQIIAQVEHLRTLGMHFDLLLPQDRNTARLFTNAGWAHLLSPHLNEPSGAVGDRHLPARQYRNSNELASLREETLEFALRFLQLQPDHLHAIEWSLDEITDNVLNHAEASNGGILQVDVPKGANYLQITVADGGRGIPKSMREGHPYLKLDRDAVGEAIKLGVTRSPKVVQGNGLAGALRVATHSGGAFNLRSHRGCVIARPDRSTTAGYNQSIRGTAPEESILGTVVELRIRTDTNFDVASALGVVNWVDDWGYLDSKYGGDDLVLKVADEAAGLGSRDSGRQVRSKLKTLLEAEPERMIALDWSGVPTVSSSFADELVGRLFSEMGPVVFNIRIRLVGMEPFVAALIDRAIRQRAGQDFSSAEVE